MLKIYEVNGRTFQYEEGTQPDGAKEVKAEVETKVETKAKTPANKAKETKKK